MRVIVATSARYLADPIQLCCTASLSAPCTYSLLAWLSLTIIFFQDNVLPAVDRNQRHPLLRPEYLLVSGFDRECNKPASNRSCRYCVRACTSSTRTVLIRWRQHVPRHHPGCNMDRQLGSQTSFVRIAKNARYLLAKFLLGSPVHLSWARECLATST